MIFLPGRQRDKLLLLFLQLNLIISDISLRNYDKFTSAGTRIGAEDNAAVVCDADDGGTHGVRSIKIHVEIHGGEKLLERNQSEIQIRS